MRWWLRNYDDQALAEIATDLTGRIVTAASMARQRSVLTASAGHEDAE